MKARTARSAWARPLLQVARRLGPYLLAIASSLLFVGLRLALAPWTGQHSFLILFILPIIVSAYVGGLGPGMVATVLVGISTAYLVLAPRGQWDISDPGDLIAWLSLIAIGTVVSSVMEALRRVRRHEAAPQVPDSTATEWKVRAGFAVALTMLGLIGMLSYYSIVEMRQYALLARKSEAAKADIHALSEGLRDMELSVDRFVITGGEAALGGYDRAVKDVGASADALGAALRGNREQTEHLSVLGTLLQRQLTLAQQSIQLRRSSFEESRTALGKGEQKRLLDQIFGVLSAMQETEERINLDDESTAAHAVRITFMAIMLASALATAFSVAALSVIGRDFAGRRRADLQLQEANRTLEMRVRERTEELAQSYDRFRERERQFGAIVGAAMDAIVSVDEQQRVVLFNPAAARIFGHSELDVVGKPLSLLFPERFRSKHAQHVEDFGKSGATN
ncbi:MAG: DUF4118 domain-containing protein, partial [Burkholderiaceae bacterium]